MPAIVINELSAVGQAADVYQSDSIMRTLAETLRELDPVRREGQIYTHSCLCNQRLSREGTVYEWLVSVNQREFHTIRSMLLSLLRRGPFIDTLLAGIGHSCHRDRDEERRDHAGSALACTAHLKGWLVSLKDCPTFPEGPVTILYGEEDHEPRRVELPHFVEPHDARHVRRRYQPHPKHGRAPTPGVVGTPMDLDDDEAQRALDRCVSTPDETRVCSRHKGRIYVFHPHRPEENLYHGFPAEDEEVREKMPELYRLL